jgi:hypothetical protein
MLVDARNETFGLIGARAKLVVVPRNLMSFAAFAKLLVDIRTGSFLKIVMLLTGTPTSVHVGTGLEGRHGERGCCS